MKNSTQLYADKDLKTFLTAKTVKLAFDNCSVKYFYDGNNGDKHLIVGHTTKVDGSIDTVLAINISQCHISGSYNCYNNVNKVIADMKLPQTGQDFVRMFRTIGVWNY